MSSPTVLVIRATGTQGRSVCKKCLEQGFKVNAIVRDAQEDRAIALEKLGVSLFEGSIDDRAVLDRAMKGTTHLFLTLMPRFDEEASELRQTRFIIAAARAANVTSIVCTTALSSPASDAALENPMYKMAKAAKLRVEEEVRDAGFDAWAVLRPGWFMSNFFWPLGDVMFPELTGRPRRFVTALEPQTVLPMIDPDDIAAFAVAAFKEPGRFDGQVISLASEMRTTEEVVEALEKVAGKAIERVWLPIEEAKELAKTKPALAGQLITRSLGETVNTEELKQWGVPLGTFEAYLEREKALMTKTFHEPRGKLMDLFEAANKPS